MGTRGICGFVVNGKALYHYNHFDSYPSCLGLAVLGFVRSMLVDGKEDEVKGKAAALRVVTDDDPITPADRKALKQWTVTRLGNTRIRINTGKADNWYNVLHSCQGDLQAVLDSGYIYQADGFPADSLFCEWGYLVNLDDRTVEVFRGFCQAPHRKGRFAALPIEDRDRGGEKGSRYYPIRLVRTFHFEDLPSDAAFKRSLGRF